MPYLIEILLFFLPFALFYLWRRFNPAIEAADPRLLPLALLGLALTLAGAAWFGFSGQHDPGAVYVPAELEPDGTIRPGYWQDRR